MAITRDFITAVDDDYAIFGWKPLGMPAANSTDGTGLAHDLLEHLDLGLDALAGELVAVGAMWHLRYESGWMPSMRIRWGRALRPDDMVASIASCFIDALRAETGERQARWPIASPGNIPPIEWDYVNDEIEEKVAEAITMAIADQSDDWDCDDHLASLKDDFASQHVQERASAWIRLGYRKAERRYRHFGAATWSTLFNRVSDEADILLKNLDKIENVRMRVRFDTHRGLVRMSSEELLDGPISIAA